MKGGILLYLCNTPNLWDDDGPKVLAVAFALVRTWTLNPEPTQSRAHSRYVCCASSLVGETITARNPTLAGSLGRGEEGEGELGESTHIYNSVFVRSDCSDNARHVFIYLEMNKERNNEGSCLPRSSWSTRQYLTTLSSRKCSWSTRERLTNWSIR